MRRFLSLCSVAILAISLVAAFAVSPQVSAAFNQNLIMDDVVFNDPETMNAAQIDGFLNSFPSSCISTNNGFASPNVVGYNPSQGFIYGTNVSAGTVINNAAKAYDLNPQVILATLQKEQSLVTGGAGCYYDTPPTQNPCPNPPYGTHNSCVVACQYAGGCVYIAMGYDCPGYCVPGSTGFSKQIIKAAWKLKFVQQRSLGNYNWNIQRPGWDNSDDPQTPYNGSMTQGVLKRNPSSDPVFYDGYRTVNNGSVAVHLDTGATASLYSYTPFLSGNQSFVNRFESWFGSTISAGYYSCGLSGVNVGGAPSGERVLSNRVTPGQPPVLSLAQLNNTGSKCVEMHTWTSSMQQWLGHVATNRPSLDPSYADVLMADLNGDGRDEPVAIEYTNTGSGRVEVHVWDNSYQRWAAHIATAHPAIDPADSEVIAGDANGDGRDELYLVRYRNNASGTVEVHGWTSNFQGYTLHSTTSHSAVDPADNRVITADTNGDAKDEFILVKYRNNGSGRVEVHGWTPNLQGWTSHMASNHSSLDPADSEVIAHDSNGDVSDELVLTKFRNTESGRVEVHGWTPNLQGWTSHIAATP